MLPSSHRKRPPMARHRKDRPLRFVAVERIGISKGANAQSRRGRVRESSRAVKTSSSRNLAELLQFSTRQAQRAPHDSIVAKRICRPCCPETGLLATQRPLASDRRGMRRPVCKRIDDGLRRGFRVDDNVIPCTFQRAQACPRCIRFPERDLFCAWGRAFDPAGAELSDHMKSTVYSGRVQHSSRRCGGRVAEQHLRRDRATVASVASYIV